MTRTTDTSSKSRTTPYTSCIFCTTKHLSYAQALLADDIDRCIVNVYLAYLHSMKKWPILANKCSDFIQNVITKQLTDNEEYLDNIVHEAHQLAIKEQDGIDTSNNKIVVNALKLSPADAAVLFTAAAKELYNYEIGYKDTNTPAVIGLLQKASMFLPQALQNHCRSAWKQIEAGTLGTTFIDFVISQIKKYFNIKW